MFSDHAIEVSNLTKNFRIYEKPQDRLLQMLTMGKKTSFREFRALADVSFSVKRGETVGLIGKNGSGKSTLLQMVCGTLTPTSGTVKVNGRIAALLELGAGFNPEFSGRDNVFLNAAILGFPQESMEERLDQVIAFSELGDFLDQPVKTYSSGMYARLAFSVAINVDPEILIVDEALAVGDARFVAKCMKRIKSLQETGVTILFVSHDVGSVRTLCDRAIWLDKGAMVEDGDVFPVTGKYMEYMFRDEEESTAPKHEDVATEQPQSVEVGSEYLQLSDAMSDVPSGIDTLDARPVTHWGSHRGLITAASVCDAFGKRADVIKWGDEIEILVRLSVPSEINRDDLSVAISIKDLKGTDLIVSTTFQEPGMNVPQSENFIARFRFKNPLVTGKFLLVAAVERRTGVDVHYYEYFEGAHYFTSLSDRRLFGLFQPVVKQALEKAS